MRTVHGALARHWCQRRRVGCPTRIDAWICGGIILIKYIAPDSELRRPAMHAPMSFNCRRATADAANCCAPRSGRRCCACCWVRGLGLGLGRLRRRRAHQPFRRNMRRGHITAMHRLQLGLARRPRRLPLTAALAASRTRSMQAAWAVASRCVAALRESGFAAMKSHPAAPPAACTSYPLIFPRQFLCQEAGHESDSPGRHPHAAAT